MLQCLNLFMLTVGWVALSLLVLGVVAFVFARENDFDEPGKQGK